MVLITGATGKLGIIVISTLLLNKVPAHQIAALARDEAKAADLKEKGIDIRIGDYYHKPSLDEAMKGIDKVFLISGLDMSKIMEQHKNVIDASKQAGEKCLGYTICGRDVKHRLVTEGETPNLQANHLVKYTYTKMQGELLLKQHLPEDKILVVRPSIIMGFSHNE